MIEIRDLAVIKNHQTICSVPTISVAEGQRLAVVGKNGSGKTTLLKVLAGLEKGYRGTCQVSVRRKERVYLQQSPYLFRGSVLFNVKYGLRARHYSRSSSEKVAMHWLEVMGVQHLASRQVRELSAGEKQRVALAQALSLEPKLLLLDEPWAEMDEDGEARLIESIKKLAESTIVMASPVKLTTGFMSQTYVMNDT